MPGDHQDRQPDSRSASPRSASGALRHDRSRDDHNRLPEIFHPRKPTRDLSRMDEVGIPAWSSSTFEPSRQPSSSQPYPLRGDPPSQPQGQAQQREYGSDPLGAQRWREGQRAIAQPQPQAEYVSPYATAQPNAGGQQAEYVSPYATARPNTGEQQAETGTLAAPSAQADPQPSGPSWEGKPWAHREDKTVLTYKDDNRRARWQTIAVKVGGGHDADDCEKRYYFLKNAERLVIQREAERERQANSIHR